MEIMVSDSVPPLVTVSGEVDFTNSAVLSEEIGRLAGNGRPSVDLDLIGIEFIDSSGIRALLQAAARLKKRGGDLRILSFGDSVRSPLVHLGLMEFFGLSAHEVPPRRSIEPSVGRDEGRWLISSFTVPPQASSGRIIRQRLGQLLADLPLTEAEVADVKLALGEATANAVKHGSRKGEGLISVRCVADSGALTLEVTDTGGGFDRQAVAEPDFSDLPTGGMGIAIMEMVMDEVTFECNQGTTVRMIKRFAPVPEA
jgi:serine/threonine-protein kinase RsbW